ncbi:putative heat shock trehalose synthase [Aspergillus lucknowensis]|uniref:Trehalose synthase N-terminal domain-containing protein n=1 Tax=Aspergillus lucknowensis TaxID=176173 RepID=A0ABR4LYH0_9EURO
MTPWTDPPSTVVYAGISELEIEDAGAQFAIVIRTPSELAGFIECKVPCDSFQEASTAVPTLILKELTSYRDLHNEKFAGVAIPRELSKKCPSLCWKVWKGLDAVPLVIGRNPRERTHGDQGEIATFQGWEEKHMDEQADSMVRKCIRSFGIGHVPLLHLDLHGRVEVDSDFRVQFADTADYLQTVEPSTWSLAQHYVKDLKSRQIKAAFFSITPHGRPDVHTRHALIRLSHCLGVDFRWYVPRPRPGLLPIIRKMDNILQGVNDPVERLTADEELRILEWVYTTAKRYWLTKGGPLRPISEGGVDLIVIDDGIMAPLALISKQTDPARPVIFENRLHIHRGPVDDPLSPGYHAWDFLRARLKFVDLLVSQEPKGFAPRLMPEKKVGYIPVAVDQFDGSNKHLHDCDIDFYGREFNSICRLTGKSVIDPQNEQYILHLVQLIPNEGTTLLLDAYKIFHAQCKAELPGTPVPKLLICHYRSPNNEQSAPIYAEILSYIEQNLPDLAHSICFIQLRPPDQLWNALLSKAMVLVQLCDAEGIPEVLLSAVQKQKPILASRHCGYFSFLQESGDLLLVGGEDADSLSGHLLGLTEDRVLSDRATTVCNAAIWFFLASKLSKGEKLEPSGADIYTLAQQGMA